MHTTAWINACIVFRRVLTHTSDTTAIESTIRLMKASGLKRLKYIGIYAYCSITYPTWDLSSRMWYIWDACSGTLHRHASYRCRRESVCRKPASKRKMNIRFTEGESRFYINDLGNDAGIPWMRVARDRSVWRTLGTYVQQWTFTKTVIKQ